ncbi:hypothetical protein PUN28_019258 [Cardiocondyla obscurior]|uniref:Uncharacterized protein n=1 Tax=Cardiocondyla obscurior TaxID=286306 RepID=A0AAW2EES0_9HYME
MGLSQLYFSLGEIYTVGKICVANVGSSVSLVNRLENSNEDVPRVYLGSRYSDDCLIP